MGTTEIIIIAIVLVILFGSKKVSEWSKGLGEATKEVSKLKKDLVEDTDPNKNNEGEEESGDKEESEPEEEPSDAKAMEDNEKTRKTAKKSKKKVDPLPTGEEDNVWSKFN